MNKFVLALAAIALMGTTALANAADAPYFRLGPGSGAVIVPGVGENDSGGLVVSVEPTNPREFQPTRFDLDVRGAASIAFTQKPAWLSFDPAAREFTAESAVRGTHPIVMVLTPHEGEPVQYRFDLKVHDALSVAYNPTYRVAAGDSVRIVPNPTGIIERGKEAWALAPDSAPLAPLQLDETTGVITGTAPTGDALEDIKVALVDGTDGEDAVSNPFSIAFDLVKHQYWLADITTANSSLGIEALLATSDDEVTMLGYDGRMYASRFDRHGSPLWSKAFGSVGRRMDAIPGPDNGLYYASTAQGGITYGLLTKEGTIAWSKIIKSTQVGTNLVSGGIEMAPDGNLVFAGSITDAYASDSPTRTFAADTVVVKVGLDGEIVWSRRVGRQNDQRVTGVAIQSNGHIFITGTSRNESNLNYSVLLQGLRPDGTVLNVQDMTQSSQYASYLDAEIATNGVGLRVHAITSNTSLILPLGFAAGSTVYWVAPSPQVRDAVVDRNNGRNVDIVSNGNGYAVMGSVAYTRNNEWHMATGNNFWTAGQYNTFGSQVAFTSNNDIYAVGYDNYKQYLMRIPSWGAKDNPTTRFGTLPYFNKHETIGQISSGIIYSFQSLTPSLEVVDLAPAAGVDRAIATSVVPVTR